MTLEDLIALIDSACWQARAYGHDDNGLQDYDTGEDIDTHPCAVDAAKTLYAEMRNREDEAYSQGHDEGHDDGYGAGYEDGHSDAKFEADCS